MKHTPHPLLSLLICVVLACALLAGTCLFADPGGPRVDTASRLKGRPYTSDAEFPTKA